MGFSPWQIRIAFPGESRLRQNRATQPTVHVGCFCVSLYPPNSDMDHGIFNVHTRGCTDTVRESALKVDREKNPLPHRRFEPASAACRSDALYQLSYTRTMFYFRTRFYPTEVHISAACMQKKRVKEHEENGENSLPPHLQ